ncbi:hypothetical protein CQW23_12584 [Capsicum baccatum]|uniref:Uncharacterized protein n=1 Tax=Capsicum baccatum TaxID=33114 RepID=A0A2G2WSY7_CAPBA|nr:hypothetical protein CQW23_12584 [Capsicum baccatum]
MPFDLTVGHHATYPFGADVTNEPHKNMIQNFFRVLAICNTIIPDMDKKIGEISYAESSDEATFVIVARELRFRFFERKLDRITLHELDHQSGKLVDRFDTYKRDMYFHDMRICRDKNVAMAKKYFQRMGEYGCLHDSLTYGALISGKVFCFDLVQMFLFLPCILEALKHFPDIVVSDGEAEKLNHLVMLLRCNFKRLIAASNFSNQKVDANGKHFSWDVRGSL